MTTTTDQSEALQEFVDSRGAEVRLDRSASVLRGVKLLGLASRNGRRYREAALRRAITLYEGAKVNVNHPTGNPLGPRDYRDRIGVIRGVRLRPGQGLFGALHFNPRHPLAEQLVWDAEHAPENVGFSHNVMARTVREGDELVVEAIEKVQSVDLVADPATTSGLFEQAEPTALAVDPNSETEGEIAWPRLTIAQLKQQRPDLFAEIVQEHERRIEQQEAEINELSSRADEACRQRRIAELLTEHGLPLPGATDPAAAKITSEAFLESLTEAADDDTLQRLVADRAEAVQQAALQQTPIVAREQTPVTESNVDHPRDATAFVESITRRAA